MNKKHILFKNRIKTSIYVDKELWEKLKELAFIKHKDFHGALTYELEEAIRNWINIHTDTHKSTQKINEINPKPKVYRIWEEVRKVLKERGYFQQAPLKEIKMAISIVRGSDKRTIKKWLIEFQKFKLIKEIAPGIYEII